MAYGKFSIARQCFEAAGAAGTQQSLVILSNSTVGLTCCWMSLLYVSLQGGIAKVGVYYVQGNGKSCCRCAPSKGILPACQTSSEPPWLAVRRRWLEICIGS